MCVYCLDMSSRVVFIHTKGNIYLLPIQQRFFFSDHFSVHEHFTAQCVQTFTSIIVTL